MDPDAAFAAEAGGCYVKRAVVLARLEGDHLAVRQSAVFGLELTVDEAV
ncbi:hypothetical protein [Kribbella shirazensis]|uniref:Uncharacterized protein n=1 Tax=Kribbella shirazensis TaxID=1105143 RepID=A0A7X5VD16_9ACTN|nr:hypothetical protein [Kribbella shirazensis]NIK58252.1 hypothetical protein [Kribbella shirazensis]